MKQAKITKNRSQGQDKDNAKSWKDKALSRRQENAVLQQRIKELTASRDNWKNKHDTLKAESSKSVALGGEKARSQHGYGCFDQTLKRLLSSQTVIFGYKT